MESKVDKATFKKSIVFLFVLLLFTRPLEALTYKTYDQWEVDALGVAWVIHTYVDANADFAVVKKGTHIEDDLAVNTPNSRFRRTAKETAFESALRYFNVNNECTKKVLPLIRVIEMAPWRKSEDMEVLNFEKDIVNTLNKKDIFAAFAYIDRFCQEVQK